MRPQDLVRLLILGALWGGSFIFMRVAAPELGAVATAETRVVVAALLLWVYAAIVRSRVELRQWWPKYLVLGIVNSALPFALICWAEVHLTASMAAILNATSPVFGAIVGAVWRKEHVPARTVLGMVVGIVGVGLLVGWSPIPLTETNLLAIGASLLAALFYGVAANYAKLKASYAPAMGMAVGSQLFASLFLALLLPFDHPSHMPSQTVLANVLALAVLSTAVAYILYYRLVVNVGPTKALTVTLLTPAFGVLWSALFLGEAITPMKVLACVLVLVGTSLATGLVGSKLAPSVAPSIKGSGHSGVRGRRFCQQNGQDVDDEHL